MTATLAPETKAILHQSILHYLHRNGFTKTLKRFQSEAQIQNDTWKDSSFNLEDIYCKYMNTSSQTEDIAVVEPETKAKMKKNKHEIKETESDEVKKPAADAENGLEINESKKNTKDKKKKKNEVEETKSDEVKKPADDAENGLEINESKKSRKDKKKKKNEIEETENGDVDLKKSSKKRKRSLSDENANGHDSDKMETKQTVEEAAKQDEVDEKKEHKNEKPEINGVEKSVKKQRVGSAEPTSAKAFQRVKIDQVEFADEKLQDNSYWAKDGADVGYGAKAQEVLGQVRGRGFRHEKTKKKRGSYRGGQIDLQSHSVKFNYSDEE